MLGKFVQIRFLENLPGKLEINAKNLNDAISNKIFSILVTFDYGFCTLTFRRNLRKLAKRLKQIES